jgi:hypothetical protein
MDKDLKGEEFAIDILIIMDCTNSMKAWMDEAKTNLIKLINGI